MITTSLDSEKNKPNTQTKNVLANCFGKGLTALILFVFTPVYIHFLGMEAYGLIGFFYSLVGMSILFDLGLSTAVNREFARQDHPQEMRDLLRTTEIVYWFFSLFFAAVLFFLAPFIATCWFHTQAFPPPVLQKTLVYMGVAVALQCPSTLYMAGLSGLQKQLLLNGVQVFFVLLRAAGSAVILWLVSTDISHFFLWQCVVSALQSLAGAFFLWKAIPKTSQASRIRVELLKKIRRFAMGVSGISITGLVLTQGDKILLSGMLSLEVFGYYCLAFAVANGLCALSTALMSAYFPLFSRLVAEKDKALVFYYHRACRWMSITILPIGVMLVLFASDILSLWTGSHAIGEQASFFLSCLVIGSMCYALSNIPYALQLAYGRTEFVFYQNVCAIFVFFPLTILCFSLWGQRAAVLIWCGINLSYLFVGMPLMYRVLMTQERKRWLKESILLPLVGTLPFPVLGKIVSFYNDRSSIPILLSLTFILSVALTYWVVRRRAAHKEVVV